jgi:two-component system sensor histidine kinase PilS (NtrC family)
MQEKILGVSTFPVMDQDGRSLGHGIIFQDITEIIIKAEHLHRMDRLACLGEMAAGLAHEIRNPLASISGAAQFLAEGDFISPEGRRLLDIIFRETSRLNRLTNSFLLYGRPTRESVEKVNTAAEVEEIIDLISRRRNLPQAEIAVEIPDEAVLETEPNQLRQILVNLLLNAWQALPQQGGRISVSGMVDNGTLELKITDNGSGIGSNDLERIFNPFFTTKPDGTGLGLAIVQRLVHDLGGEIKAVSTPGRGTEFIMTLPLAGAAGEEEHELLEKAA